MGRLLIALSLLALSACALPAAVTTTTAERDTQPPPPVTTTLHDLDVEVQSCASPPVTFSALCEIYELLDAWYVDTPIDPSALAEVAERGLGDFDTTETEEPPRTLFCAIPHSSFTGLCDTLADKVETSQIPIEQAVEAATSYMIEVGLDPFTYYLTPDQAGTVRLNGIVGGIGVVIDARDAAGSKCTRITETCQLEIVVVLEDNPGSEAGLAPGDIITTVDGEPVAGQGFTAVVTLITGDETGPVDLTLLRDGIEIELTIEREELSVPTVEVAVPFDDVGYIKIPDFEFDIPELVEDGLADLAAEGTETLVIDLRDNPGGYVDAFLDVVDHFVDGGIVMLSEATTEHLEYKANSGGVATTQRLLVLVNQGTASAAEILAGALRDRREAVIVGTDTFGKDAVQIPFTLRNGGELYVAVARWSTPNGHTVGNGGLAPDRELEWPSGLTIEQIVELALEAAS